MNKILIIDDDVELAEMLAEYLGSEGFTVDCVHDGQSGVKQSLEKNMMLLHLM